jgi:hypothetical protein
MRVATLSRLVLAVVALTAIASAPAAASPRIVARQYVSPIMGPMRYDPAHGAVWIIADAGGTASLFKLDPDTLGVESVTALDRQGQAYYSLAVGLGRVWVSNFPDDYEDHSLEGSISQYAGDGTFIRTIPTYGHGPEGAAFLGGDVWVANHHQDAPGTGGSIVRLDPDTGALLGRVPIGAPIFCCGPQALEVADGRLWTGVPNLDAIGRIDPASLDVDLIGAGPAAPQGGLPVGACGAIAVDERHGRIWVGDGGCLPSQVSRVDTGSGTITQSFNPGGNAFGLDYGLGSLWASVVSSGFQGKSSFLARIDPDSGNVTAKIATGGLAFDVAVGDGAVFVVTPLSGEILRVAP